MSENVETLVIGGGQAGLALSYHLRQLGRSHLVLERAQQAGEAWRNHRWDSFTFVTPNWMIRMPGAHYSGTDPHGFLPRAEIVRLFEDYVRQHKLPIRFGIEVTCVSPEASDFRVDTSHGPFKAANVVVATGTFQTPRVPTFSDRLPAGVDQLSADDYRNPASLKPGAVLVVGTGQSGCQIAEELYLSGRKVYLSVGRMGRLPRRYRGCDITEWLLKIGFFDRTADQLPSPQARGAGNPHLSGTNGGHTLNLHLFARDGVTLLGRLQDVREGNAFLAADLHESLARVDSFESEMIRRIDVYIERFGSSVPTESILPATDGYSVEMITEIDLKRAGITSVVWAAGFRFDYSLVNAPILDPYGYPRQERGVTPQPGLYFLGLNWLHTFKSGLVFGVGDDAEYVASKIALG